MREPWPSPGRSACQSGNWSVGVRGPSPGSRPGCASAPRIPLSASWPRPIGGAVSSPGRSSCSAPASSAPALWPAGGRADGRRELPSDAPGVMWGTDAAVIPTVEDGNIALFVVVEHWNAEALGWHVAEKADRFAAAQAFDLAIHTACGAVRADAARGLLLRHDHGSA